MAWSAAETAPRILGLTGAIGCGKTTVGDLLLELGAIERIDADRVVHALMVPGTQVTAQIREAFGAEVIARNSSVDRPALARLVFGDQDRLRQLEGIVHPAVREAIRDQLDDFRGQEGIVILDAVRLLQSDLLPLVEEVWVVRCSPDMQLARLTTIRGMSVDEARGRLSAQPLFEHPRVTRFIDNSGTLDDLREHVGMAWRAFAHAT